jgi:myosin heavy subunit
MFTAQRMLDQLRYAGLLEVCRIRKLGYPVRREFEDFFKRFRCITPGATSINAQLQGLVQKGVLVGEEWAKGHTKVFMRTQQALSLEMAREEAYALQAKKVQKVVRGFIWRCKWKQYKRILDNIKKAMAARSEEELTHWLDMSAELPHAGARLPLLREARALQVRLAEERRIKNLLDMGIRNRDLSGLRAAVQAAASMHPPLESPLIPEAQSLIARLEEELRLKAQLTIAINTRNKDQIVYLLAKAYDLDLDCDEVRQAAALKARIDEEEEAVEMLRQAIQDRNVQTLTAFIAKCQELGLDIPEVEQGRKVLQRVQAELAAKAALAAAIHDRVLEALLAALEKAHGILDDSVSRCA